MQTNETSEAASQDGSSDPDASAIVKDFEEGKAAYEEEHPAFALPASVWAQVFRRLGEQEQNFPPSPVATEVRVGGDMYQVTWTTDNTAIRVDVGVGKIEREGLRATIQRNHVAIADNQVILNPLLSINSSRREVEIQAAAQAQRIYSENMALREAIDAAKARLAEIPEPLVAVFSLDEWKSSGYAVYPARLPWSITTKKSTSTETTSETSSSTSALPTPSPEPSSEPAESTGRSSAPAASESLGDTKPPTTPALPKSLESPSTNSSSPATPTPEASATPS
jgi:hypothetical protein